MFVFTSILSLDLIFQYIIGYNEGIPIENNHGGSRASSFFGDELVAGSYILKIDLPVLGYLLYKNKYLFFFLLLIIRNRNNMYGRKDDVSLWTWYYDNFNFEKNKYLKIDYHSDNLHTYLFSLYSIDERVDELSFINAFDIQDKNYLNGS